MDKVFRVQLNINEIVRAETEEQAIEMVAEMYEMAKYDVKEIVNPDSFLNKPELPDGLQKYIDGVALNILYSNYHKSTNGIWSRAVVEFEHENEDDNKFWEVQVDFGCQDDTRNEQYSETICVYKLNGAWTFDFNTIEENK